ncbi:hypothetical protein MXB_4229 [Myxobolus squamalis]|nr:hypothetical protein MXB_4229 [Myxobolus squamalis]
MKAAQSIMDHTIVLKALLAKRELLACTEAHLQHYLEVKTEGVKSLFRGFVPVMIRAFPTNAVNKIIGYIDLLSGLRIHLKFSQYLVS